MYKINVFAAKLSLSWIHYLNEMKPANCVFFYYTYDSFEDLKTTLQQHLSEGDGALFSGQIPYFFAQTQFDTEAIPMAYFDISERDFYRVLTELFYREKISLSELAIDFCYEENDYLGIHEWSMGEGPHLFSQTVNSYATQKIVEHVITWHEQLHKQKKVKLSLTRVAEVPEELEKQGIPYVFVHPSKHAIKTTLKKFMNRLELERLRQNQLVVAHIDIPVDKMNVVALEYRQIALYKSILDLKEQEQTILVHREASSIVLLTTYATFMELTHDKERCELVAYLDETLSFPVKVGWGIGQDVRESRLFAQRAAQLCSSKETQGFIMEQQAQRGPLLPGVVIPFEQSYQSHLQQLSETYDVPLVQLQKIDAVVRQLNTPILNGELLSEKLNMTVRSANRILQHLQEKQLAKQLPAKASTSRGRPKKFYEIQFPEKGEMRT